MNTAFLQPSWLQRVRIGLSQRAGFAAASLALLGAGLGLSWLAHSTSTAPSYPAIALSSTPLYATTPIDKPSLALALSVEYPTVGAQYTPGGSSDNTYSNATEYLGYYDAESCYTYNDSPSETPATGLSATDYKRFDRSGPATSRKCSNAFSGNFLNWASSSAIDMLRLALSGGDRYIDQDGLTILQRALIPNGDPICMWNSSNFPAKQLTKDGGGAGTYWGAVPTAMITAANGSDIYVANTLNRIYFGTSATGDCGSGPSSYVLNTPAANQAMGPITTYSNKNLPGSATYCASENGTCSFTGTLEVWYGSGTKWAVAPVKNGVGCNNNVFGDPYPGVGKSCYTRTYTGTWTPPAATGSQLNSDGFFYSRVQVCNKSSGALADVRDYGLCSLYPSGNYKPTGVIQKYSDQLRLAAFGYLMDQTASYNTGGRYGGVLRAPMKYVGYKTFDENGNDNTPSTGNANVEWNTTTGIYVANPDSDAMGISGVVNYLNKFGRTGPVLGRYKIYDPVGELHYEVLRYLQGLSPSADAISNITDTYKDGYPVFTTWTDPYGGSRSSTADYSCVRSNIVVIGDINTHDGNRLPSVDMDNNIIDINAWRSTVQNFEQNNATTYVDGQGTNRTTGNPNGANWSVPTNTTTSQIMGSAYWAHTHDIRGTTWKNATTKQRPGLRVKTFLFDVNEYGAQNDANTRHYANQFFMASKYGGFETDASNVGSNPYNTWGNPFKQQDGTNNNNVWQNLTSPGEASTYYLQSSARGVLSAFNGIFSRAANSSRNIAGVALHSNYLAATNGSVIYQGAFDTSNWTGDVLALPLTVSGSTVALGTNANWSAADMLTNRANPATSRTNVMGVAGATANPAATDFQWASISTTVQAALNKASPTAATDSLGQSRLNYLRGDRSLEGTTFRTRSKLLGDIINSSVVYSGKPAAGYTENAYSTFYSNNASRTAAVYVGANDGMLHAFNASTGAELFGYIPSWMSTKLSALTGTSYANNHQSYVDGLPAVAEACVGASHTLSATTCTWKSVLVSGTGGGGQGLFALDVTDPTAFSASKVMWEFTNADDNDLGYVVGQPQILKLVTSAPGATSTTYRWFAVVASGVDNYVTDANGRFSSTGNPTLFFLALDKAAGAAWTLGTNYYKVSLPLDTTLAATKAPGVANFTALYDAAGAANRIFVGDLHGKLWKLDFTPRAVSTTRAAFDPTVLANWTANNLSFFSNSGDPASPSAYPMYIAKDSSGNNQPIFSPPRAVTGPVVGGLQTFYVIFGSGKFLESGDKTSTAQNSIYAVYDDGKTTLNQSDSTTLSSTTPSVITGRTRLQAGALTTTTTTSGGVTTTTNNITVSAFAWGRPMTDTATYSDTSTGSTVTLPLKSGWYFDLPVTGEKMISNFLDLSPQVTFNTIIPGAAGATGSCTATPGSGNQYVVNIATGNGTYTASTVGLLGSSLYVDTDGSSVPDPNGTDSTGRRKRTTTKTSLQSGSSGSAVAGTTVTITDYIGRLSWRQINNYWDLKAAP